MTRPGRILLGVFAIAALAVGSSAEDNATARSTTLSSLAVEFTDRQLKRVLSHSPLPEVPADETNAFADDPAAAHLGQYLFFDTRLSANGAVSCATCHDPQKGFSDGRPLASGIGEMTRHAQPLFNVAHNRWLFWDGRADTLWAQALDPIETDIEHGFTRSQCAHLVHDDPDLRAAYERVFGPLPDLSDARRFPREARPVPKKPDHPHGMAWSSMSAEDQRAINRVFSNLGKAIAAYERRLASGRSAFDVFVEGLREGDDAKVRSLTPQAQRGLQLFVGRANCRLCHFGPNFTDGEFHSTGVPPHHGGRLRDAGRYAGIDRAMRNPFNAAGEFSDAPDGAAAEKVTSLVRTTESWGQFKTPSLRNVALTGPYMHQGQFETLEEVLRHYSSLEHAVLPGHHQEQILVPQHFTEDEIDALLSFLGSLTGAPLDASLLKQPDLPMAP